MWWICFESSNFDNNEYIALLIVFLKPMKISQSWSLSNITTYILKQIYLVTWKHLGFLG